MPGSRRISRHGAGPRRGTPGDPGRYRTPCVGGLHAVLAGLDAVAFEDVLRRWILAQGVGDPGQLVSAFDGESLRGTRGHEVRGVHLLAVCCQGRAMRRHASNPVEAVRLVLDSQPPGF